MMKMADWVKIPHSFSKLSNYPILQDKSKVSPVTREFTLELLTINQRRLPESFSP